MHLANSDILSFASITTESPLSACKLESSAISSSLASSSTTQTIDITSNGDNHHLENVPSSMAAALLGLGIRSDSSNDSALNGKMTFGSVSDWSLLKDFQSLASTTTNQLECSSTASTSSSTLMPSMPILIPVTSFLSSGLSVKRPSSAIGIAQRNGIILSPINNLEGRSGLFLQSDTPPTNKIRKIETGSDEFVR